MADRVLVSWIGHADLLAMLPTLSPAKQTEVLALTKKAAEPDGPGPLKTLLDVESFRSIHLIANYPERVCKWYSDWLGKKPIVHSVKLKNPSDYAELLGVVRPVLDSLKLESSAELCFHLSPGTPAMAAIWILLGKSMYPAKLYQAYKGQATETHLPFDLTVDVLPGILREPDRFWQHLIVDSPQDSPGFEGIIGKSQAIRAAVGRAQRAAIHDVPVLILGESGTGKEMFAEAMHLASHRRSKPFLMVNCAAMPENLLESELFGHVKGAFTDAKDRKGLFALADGGTLFLDEIGECSLSMQAKLLRVLQPHDKAGPCHRVFRRVGDSKDLESDVRVIAATNRDLSQLCSTGTFREDLLYRLATITIKLPPLRERGTDCGMLAEAILRKVNAQFRQQHGDIYLDKSISADAKRFVQSRSWPGNVRQLKNVIIQAAVMSKNVALTASDIHSALADFPGHGQPSFDHVCLGNGFEIEGYLQEIRKQLIQRALAESGGKVTHAAKLLGMQNYQTLSAQIDRFGVEG